MIHFIKTFALPILVILILVDLICFRIILKLSNGIHIIIYALLILLILEYYSFVAFKNVIESRVALWAYILFHIVLYGSLIYLAITGKRGFSSEEFKYILVIITLIMIPKLIVALTFIVDDWLRMLQVGVRQVKDGEPAIPSRRRVVTWIGLGLASIPFLAVLDGILFGKYRYRVIKKQLFFDDLPQEFDGFTITQISDIHSGSFDDTEKVKYGVEMANAQNSDILVFTGDMVNNVSDEFEPYKEIFAVLSAKEGMFSTLGNHDYGDYGELTEQEKQRSIARIQEMQREIGFVPLNNEMRTIERQGKRLNIVGVENWGHSDHFPKKGDLRKATAKVQEGDFNVLLSHDPSHFDHNLKAYDNVINFPKKMHLTLSGHTHGMQFGIEIPGLIKWSPVQYRYHHWAGLYEEKGRKLYVNRGFGYLAFPGRVGMWPEITVLELKRKVEA